MKSIATLRKMILAAVIAAIYMPINAHAVFITTSLGDFEVTTFESSYDPLNELFTSQVWWGNVQLAEEFAALTNTAFGTPNLGLYSPFFWYTDTDTTGPCSSIGESHAGVFWNSQQDRVSAVCSASPLSSQFTFAMAEAVSVPEPPVLLMMGLGLAGLGVSRFKRQTPLAKSA